MAAWKWLVVRHTIYELTSQRLRLRRGVINKRVDQLELYRVKDYRVDEPLFLRMLSLSNVVLETSDKTDPVLVLAAVRDGETIQNLIRNQVEHLRDRKRVREIDFD
ncbi:MAG: PH domain-containing protein [Deltaproteobacteria bacterium]|nr:PH domain-containing protein [Deltaproteobacteria bacterium]